MAPFRYETPSSPFGATIAELLAHQSDASIRAQEQIAALRARAQEQAANIQAQAGLEGARAWGGAVQTLGNLPLNVVKTMSDKRLDDAKIAGLTAETGLRQQALAAQQRQAAGQQALAGAMRTSVDLSQQPQGPDLSQPNGVVPQIPNFLRPEGNGVSTWDVEGLSKYMTAQGYGDLNQQFVKDVNGLNEVVRTEAAARQATIRHIADVSYRMKNDPTIANELVRTLEVNQFYPPEMLDKIKSTIGTPAFDQIVDGLRTPDKFENAAQGTMARNVATGELKPGSAVPDKPQLPTRASLASAAAGGNPTEALKLLQPPQVPRPLPEQLLEAITRGDTTMVDNISKTLHTEAVARQDPAAAALATQLKNLSVQEAQQRLDALKTKNEPVNISPDVQTTISGKKYVDASIYTGETRNKAIEAAKAQGIIPVSKEDADTLKNIDNARANQRDILAQIDPLLPKNPVSRAAALIATPLEKLFQTNDQIAAFNSWRAAAINTLRATAGSKGLRINQAEIALAIENDIPKLTDTAGTAQQKIKNITTLLNNAEAPILVRDRSVPVPPAGPDQPPALTPGLQQLRDR